MNKTGYTGIILLLVAVVSIPCPLSSVAWADESDLAKQTQNPVTDLISIPFQNNMHFGLEPIHRTQNVLNIQPVIPLNLTENWNLIARKE